MKNIKEYNKSYRKVKQKLEIVNFHLVFML